MIDRHYSRRGLKRHGMASYLYLGFVIRRLGRSYTVERFTGERTLGADSFNRLWKAREHVEWLASTRGRAQSARRYDDGGSTREAHM